MDGEVVETGGAGRGFYLRVKPLAGPIDMRHLLRGAEVKPWLMREMERLQLALAWKARPPPASPMAASPWPTSPPPIPEADWDAVCGEMFLEP